VKHGPPTVKRSKEPSKLARAFHLRLQPTSFSLFFPLYHSSTSATTTTTTSRIVDKKCAN
jgi:hypothetical protein